MKKNQDQPADAAELRRRAEAQLQRQESKRGGQATEVETVRLVHELEVHQIELEMQNEELQRMHAQAEALLARYTDLYDFAPTGYFNLARDGTILAVNLTGARLLGIERPRLLNRRLGLLVSVADRPAFNAFLEKTFAGKGRDFCEVALPEAEPAPLFVRIEAVVSEDRQACRAAVLDVTDHRRAEAERERLIQELQIALTRVKALSGLLPICANCKKIRDDQGYWKQVETYIRSHSEATFTHSICPECRHKLYPELDDLVPEPATRGTPTEKIPPPSTSHPPMTDHRESVTSDQTSNQRSSDQ
jgi:PAS domain-containing protein